MVFSRTIIQVSVILWDLIIYISSLQQKSVQERQHKFGTNKNYANSSAGTDDESEDDTEAGARYSGSWHRQLSPCSVLSAASSGRLYAEPAPSQNQRKRGPNLVVVSF